MRFHVSILAAVVILAVVSPLTEYESRHERAQAKHKTLQSRFLRIGNWRLVIALVTVLLLWLIFGQHAASASLLALPVLAFAALVVWHQSVIRLRTVAARTVAYYTEALNRVRNEWSGQGVTGERFRNPDHVYSEDLDLFGTGSLFQLLSRARTTTGEGTLAQWLLAPSARQTVLERQAAVRELTSALNLREEIALLGEDVAASVHPGPIADWGAAPPFKIPSLARPAAFALSLGGVATLVAYFLGALPLFPFVLMFAVDALLLFSIRHQIAHIAESVEIPGLDLNTLSLLIERLEREHFQTPRLQQLREALSTDGIPASRRIAHLRRWVELIDSTDHILLRILDPVLLLRAQLAMAIEHWRRQNGPQIGPWIDAVAEFEALSSLACLSFERPEWIFPTLDSGTHAHFGAEALRHPLIATDRCIPNDVSLGSGTDLLIVSGSNMSGKSTLLRSIGLNTVLAWAGAPTSAAKLTVSDLRLGVSLRVSDSLQDNRSRFFAEITRIRHIVDLTRGDQHILFLLDELLSGTNSHDRRIGAAAIVHGLLREGSIGVLTTHDLAIAEIERDLQGRAANVHLEDTIVDGRMEFDYKLRPGVVTHSNALALMRAVGLDV